MLRLLFVTLALAWGTSCRAATDQVKVLIIDGQNNHGWITTSPLLKRILEDNGRFTVEVTTTPLSKAQPPTLPQDATPEQKISHEQKLKAYAEVKADYKARTPRLWAAWRPRFTDYDVVVSNYNGERWPDARGVEWASTGKVTLPAPEVSVFSGEYASTRPVAAR